MGVDRGSASQISKLDDPATFLTFSNTGSDVAGRATIGIGRAQPNVFQEGDQLDATGVWAGPSEDGGRELLAGGVSYRFSPFDPATTFFVIADYGDLILGTDEALALEAEGRRFQVATGLRHERRLGDAAQLLFDAQFLARHIESEVLGAPVIDEDLRILRASVLYQKGVPLLFQQRLFVSMSKGLNGLGASPDGAPSGSIPGSDTDFLRVSFSAEASLPLSRAWVVNAGIIGQWTDDSLPASQRCGFQTNAYARAFDYSLVSSDRCLGGRAEIAYNLELPDLSSQARTFTQAFAGIDGGTLDNRANDFLPATRDSWSSLSVGVRTLRGNFLGEIAITHIVDRPEIAANQDDERLWFRAAIKF